MENEKEGRWMRDTRRDGMIVKMDPIRALPAVRRDESYRSGLDSKAKGMEE
jgi:hypothetical protein